MFCHNRSPAFHCQGKNDDDNEADAVGIVTPIGIKPSSELMNTKPPTEVPSLEEIRSTSPSTVATTTSFLDEDDVGTAVMTPRTVIRETGYISKNDLEVLLTPNFLDAFEDQVNKDNDKMNSEIELRKELVQNELLHILDLADSAVNNDIDVVEAVADAANTLAYKSKIYDVATCSYIFVPSIAYCILNGDLLNYAMDNNDVEDQEVLRAYVATLERAIVPADNSTLGDSQPRPLKQAIASSCKKFRDSPALSVGDHGAEEVYGWSPVARRDLNRFDFATPRKEELETRQNILSRHSLWIGLSILLVLGVGSLQHLQRNPLRNKKNVVEINTAQQIMHTTEVVQPLAYNLLYPRQHRIN